MSELSFTQTYFICLVICIIAAWVVQAIDNSDDAYGFSVTVFIVGLVPVLNVVIASIIGFISAICVLGIVASAPKIIRGYRK